MQTPIWLTDRAARWLPEPLEIVKSDVLEEARKPYDDAVAALREAKPDKRDEAALRLAEVVEATIATLAAGLPYLETAWGEAAKAVVPKTRPRSDDDVRATQAREVDEFNREAERINKRIRDETVKLAPRKVALEHDAAKLRRIRALVEPNTLRGPAGLPVPADVAAAERVREEVSAVTPRTLEQRVEALESARS